MFRRNFFGTGQWGGARPTAHLAGAPRVRMGALANGCIVPGTQDRPVFQYNPTTKVCGVFWMDTSTAQYPECVKAPEGYLGGGYQGWIPPGCMPAEAPPPPPPPTPTPAPSPTPTPGGGLPPTVACPLPNNLWTLVSLLDGSIVAEGIQRYQFEQYTLDVTDLGYGRTCDDDPRCKPICGTPSAPPVTPVPPVTSITPVEPVGPTSPAPSVPSCCTTYWEETQKAWYAKCNAPGEYHQGYEGLVDPAVLKSWETLCAPAAAPTPTTTPTPTPTSVISPTSASAPVSASPVIQVSPGASVPIVPGPFSQPPAAGPIPISPAHMPAMPAPTRKLAPQGQMGPSQRPACKVTPYKTHMFPGKTIPTRPDAFTDTQQWAS